MFDSDEIACYSLCETACVCLRDESAAITRMCASALRIFNHSTMGKFALIYKLFNLFNTDQFGSYSFNGDHVVILMNAMLLWCRLTVHCMEIDHVVSLGSSVCSELLACSFVCLDFPCWKMDLHFFL